MNVQIAPRVVAGVNLDELVDALLRADPEIFEIVLFGSAAYAPDLARDVDVYVTTRLVKEYDIYLDVAEEFSSDILVHSPRDAMNPSIALGIAAFGQALYGSGAILQEARKYMGTPTFIEARKLIVDADDNLFLAHQRDDPFYRDRRYRKVFDALFDAARYAAMAFAVTDDTRWKLLARQLPAAYEEPFRTFISVLHVQYHYDGRYPKDGTDQEYYKWRVVVTQFIDDLESDTQARQQKSQDEENQVD